EVSQIDKSFRERTVYQALDFGSRNAYRNRIDQLARRSPSSEIVVAEAAIALSEKASSMPDSDPRETNIGAFIVGRRRRELEAAVGYKPRFVQRFVRVVRKLNWLAIAGPVILITLLAMAAAAWFLVQAEIPLP